jgi:crotonobetainyl-CoA:carnitine CoA-transferase CaiB-like acyl-CoA transferase
VRSSDSSAWTTRRSTRRISFRTTCGSVQQRETIYADPQVGAEALIAEVEQEDLGVVRLLAPFLRVGGDACAAAPAPSLGADTESILAELR